MFWSDNGSEKLCNLPLVDYDRQAVLAFFSTPWFTRLWVVQEVLLGRDVLCYQGTISRSWATVSLAAQWIRYRQLAHNLGDYEPGLDCAKLMWRWSYRGHDLRSLLVNNQMFQATEPLDKIYGMLGLLIDSTTSNTTLASDLLVDYNARLDEVYTAATKAAIFEWPNSPGGLAILERAEPTSNLAEQQPRWPSWVPRYDLKHDDDSPSHQFCFDPGAASGLPAVVREVAESSKCLSVQGYEISRSLEPGLKLSPSVIFGDLQALPAELSNWRKRSGVSSNTLAITALSGFDAHAEECEGLMAGLGGAQSQSDNTNMSVLEASSVRNEIWERSGNKRLFLTRDGRLGTGPPGMQAGDSICIVFGSYWPFVMRREQRRWRLIGTAYIHGIMTVSTAAFELRVTTLICAGRTCA